MKKLALLLAAMTAVSAVASAKEVVAAPVVAVEAVCPETVLTEEQEMAIYNKVKKNYKGLRATSLNIELEWEREYGDSGIEGSFSDLVYSSTAGFAYGDNWTGSIQGLKYHGIKGGDYRNNSSRVQFDVNRAFRFDGGKQFGLGVRYRTYTSEDRYYVRGNYRYPMANVTLSGWTDVAYKDVDGGTSYKASKGSEIYTKGYTAGKNSYFVEAMPLNITINQAKFGSVGPLTLGYYIYFEHAVGNNDAENLKDQIRFDLPLYRDSKFSVAFHQRVGLKEHTKNAAGLYTNSIGHASDSGFDYNMSQIKFGYNYSDASSFYLNLAYGRNKWVNPAGKKVNADYTDVTVGWNYKF